MDKEQQRIKIAEACGLFRLAPLKRTNRKGKDDPSGVRLWFCDSDHGGAKEYVEIPNYPEDLNAMHEAEKVLSDLQYRKYCNLLDEAGYDDRGVNYPTWSRSATASERAEAFLKTLNLWEE